MYVYMYIALTILAYVATHNYNLHKIIISDVLHIKLKHHTYYTCANYTIVMYISSFSSSQTQLKLFATAVAVSTVTAVRWYTIF